MPVVEAKNKWLGRSPVERFGSSNSTLLQIG